MRIGLLYSHHRRCGQWYYKRAATRLGLEVVSVGAWCPEEPFGSAGRQPDIPLPRREPPHYNWRELAASIDALLVYDGGEGLRLLDDPPIPWAHLSTEGGDMTWSIDRTPHRYAEIMCNGADSGVQWLPKAFDVDEHHPPHGVEEREYDLVQLASARESRKAVWEAIRRNHPDLNCVFGDIWGALYGQTYRRTLATWVCSTVDFVTTRVFEAMAMGCIVIADRTPSIQELFRPGEHFIGYDPEIRPDREGVPDIEWLTATVRSLRESPSAAERIRRAATDAVWVRNKRGIPRHSYDARLLRVLAEMGF